MALNGGLKTENARLFQDLAIDSSGGVLYGGRFVGEFDEGVLRLNLGWCRLAGLSVVVEGDSKTDRRAVLLHREA